MVLTVTMIFCISGYVSFNITEARGSFFTESVSTIFRSLHHKLDVARMMGRVRNVMFRFSKNDTNM